MNIDLSSIFEDPRNKEYIFYEFIVPKLKKTFFLSPEWRELRIKILERDNYTCQICGQEGGSSMHIDHIEPISRNWERRLDPSNLQVLCPSCNIAKSNTYHVPEETR
jgi:5-methylcytosine-specific restriction endonuclease McrA